MSYIHIYFKHYKCLFPIDLAQQIISPYFQDGERKKFLMDELDGHINLVFENNYDMNDSLFICGNEIFPESAISDPLSDLNTYDEWQNGRRNYPFKGLYPPFGIDTQLEKIESSSSFGVVGEILAGVFSQSYFAPFILVRNIRRWPDFIFINHDNRYVFVESKATASEIDQNGILDGDFEYHILSDFIMDSMKSFLNSETTNVCLSQTRIAGDRFRRIFHLNILEMQSSSTKSPQEDNIPPSVVSGLAYQVVDQYISSLFTESGPLEYSGKMNDEIKSRIKYFYKKNDADQIKDQIYKINSLDINEDDDSKIDKKIKEIMDQLSKKKILDFKNIGKNMKKSITSGAFNNIATVCNQNIFYKKMSSTEENSFLKIWQPDWNSAIKPYNNYQNKSYWRCGNSILYVN